MYLNFHFNFNNLIFISTHMTLSNSVVNFFFIYIYICTSKVSNIIALKLINKKLKETSPR